MTETSSDRASSGASDTPAPESGPPRTLTSRALRGATFLFGREALGSVVRLAGVIVVTREIGPANYGVFTAAAAFTAVVVTIAQMGSEVYLIRVKDTPTDRLNNEVFTLLLCTSVAATAISLGLTFAFAGLLRPVGVALPLRVLLICVPINVLWAPAQAYIERRFDYMKMGALELGGDIVLYATAVPLAILKFGAWSLVIGYFAWQSFLLIGSIVLSGLRPRLAWSFDTARDVAKHGTSYSTSSLFANLANVVNPLVVGTFVGAAGVGYVAFARNLVTTVGFAKRCAYRLGIVTMAQIHRDDPSQFRKGLERGAFLLTLGLAVPLAGFGLAAHWIIPELFGNEWSAAIPIYCLLALASLLGSAQMIEESLFYAVGRNGTVAFSAFLQTAVLAVTSVLFVHLWGINGFGIASLVALVAFIWLDRRMRRIATYSYKLAITVMLIATPAMFIPVVPPPLGLLLLVPWVLFLMQPLRGETISLWHSLRTSTKARLA